MHGIMTGQVGHWDEGVDVGFGSEMLDWLDGMFTDRHVRVSVTEGREVVVLPDPRGFRVSGGNARMAYGDHVLHPMEGVELNLSRFELFETGFHVCDARHALVSTPLPADHELPWPRLRSECDAYEARIVVKAELTRRLKSVLRVGGTRFESHQHPSDRLKAHLHPGDWAEAVREAKEAYTV